jgi:hypothetical protein
MVERLKVENKIDVYDFVINTKDIYHDFYITVNKERLFLKDCSLIKKALAKYQCYGLFNNGLKAILIIVQDKGYRPYVKLLAENSKYTIDFLKWLKWNFSEKDLYFKLKKDNPLSEKIKRTGFISIGNRGNELLFYKKGIKTLYKIIPKDVYLEKTENRLY